MAPNFGPKEASFRSIRLRDTLEKSMGKSLSFQGNVPLTQHLSHSRDKSHTPSLNPNMPKFNTDQISSPGAISETTTAILNNHYPMPTLRSNHKNGERNITISHSSNLPQVKQNKSHFSFPID